VANLANAQADPPDPGSLPSHSAYEWDGAPWEDTAEATDSNNWHHPYTPGTLPEEGSQLHFGNRPNLDEDDDQWNESAHLYPSWYEVEIIGFGDAPLTPHFSSLWFGFGGWNAELSYTLSGSQITVGYGNGAAPDRLIVAEGRGSHTLDLDVVIYNWTAPFRIHNGLARLRHELDGSAWDTLTFSKTITAGNHTLIVSGYGRTVINALHSTGNSGTLIKEGTGLLEVDATGYEGNILIRGGALRGNRSETSYLTLAGGVYLLESGEHYQFELYGSGSKRVNWLEGESGGFGIAGEGGTAHLVFGSGSTLTWGALGFVSLGSELLFGSEWSSGSLYWNNPLALGPSFDLSPRTIRLARNIKADETFTLYLSQRLTAASDQVLRLIGGGTVVVTKDNYDFQGDLDIAGVDLVLRDQGTFRNAGHFIVRDGGTLSLGSRFSLPANPIIALSSGTLNTEDWIQLDDLSLSGGANQIIHKPNRWGPPMPLFVNSLTRTDPRSTLLASLLDNDNFVGTVIQFTPGGAEALAATAIDGITPWLVTTTGADDSTRRADWAVIDGPGLRRSHDYEYYTDSEWGWSAEHNVNVAPSGWGPPLMLFDDRTINSLRLEASGSVRLNGNTLTIASGGLLLSGNAYGSIGDEGYGWGYSPIGELTTTANRPLYVHTHGELSIYAKITGGMDLVKASAGTLRIGSPDYDQGHDNDLGSLYIHEGRLEVRDGARIHATGPIYVGDGGHSATLALVAPDNPWGPPLISGKREVRLRGGHDFSKAATLELVGSHDLHLDHLSISGSSILEFQPLGGTSKIYSEVFTIESESSRLHVRGWLQRHSTSDDTAGGFTHILVNKNSPLLDDYLSQIWFEGYGDAVKIDWHEDYRYWEIVPGWRGWGNYNPGGSSGGVPPPPGEIDCPECPEPSTYGAILGAVGLGLAVWRKRKGAAH